MAIRSSSLDTVAGDPPCGHSGHAAPAHRVASRGRDLPPPVMAGVVPAISRRLAYLLMRGRDAI